MKRFLTPDEIFQKWYLEKRLGFWEKIIFWRNYTLTPDQKLKTQCLEFIEKLSKKEGKRRSIRIKFQKLKKISFRTEEAKEEELRRFRVPGYLSLLRIISY
jgi:hypothetical protein